MFQVLVPPKIIITHCHRIMPMLIGLVGKKFSGKDTVGKHLTQQYAFERVSFADRLKSHCQIRYGFKDSQLEATKDTIDERWGFTPRQTFKDTGMAYRKIDPNYWSNQVEFDIVTSDKDIVVTDVRFQNEADMISKNGGILLRIMRSDTENDDHISETSLDSINVYCIISNNDTIDSLNIQVDRLMDTML